MPASSTTTIPTHLHDLPSCTRLPMYIKEVAPHRSMAKIDFIDECSNRAQADGDQAGTAERDFVAWQRAPVSR